jgi:hypothetical protein
VGRPRRPFKDERNPNTTLCGGSNITSCLGRVAAYRQELLNEALAAKDFNPRRVAAPGLTYDQLRHRLKKHPLNAHAER